MLLHQIASFVVNFSRAQVVNFSRAPKSNWRNGATNKMLKGDFGELPLETPLNRNGSYEPKIISKGQTLYWLR